MPNFRQPLPGSFWRDDVWPPVNNVPAGLFGRGAPAPVWNFPLSLPLASAPPPAQAPAAAYVYAEVDSLQGTSKVGSKQCVALLQVYAHLPQTSHWKQGAAVLGNKTIVKGTAIATFVHGKYANKSTGNHAAFYLSQDAHGIWVMDQWFSDKTKPTVSKRYLRSKGKLPNGSYRDPSNNADAFSVIAR